MIIVFDHVRKIVRHLSDGPEDEQACRELAVAQQQQVSTATGSPPPGR